MILVTTFQVPTVGVLDLVQPLLQQGSECYFGIKNVSDSLSSPHGVAGDKDHTKKDHQEASVFAAETYGYSFGSLRN